MNVCKSKVVIEMFKYCVLHRFQFFLEKKKDKTALFVYPSHTVVHNVTLTVTVLSTVSFTIF